MVAEIGLFTLVLAFMLALAQSALPLIGAARGDEALMASGRMMAVLQAIMTILSFAALMICFAQLDLSVALVADHAHSTQPVGYRIAAAWGNHEGSMLLWVLILAIFGAAVALFGGNLRRSLQARVIGVQGLICAAFLAFSLFTSNPFRRLSSSPMDGAELNPMLQDPGLIFHPPLLYLGYVGFSVAFAFAMAALIEGRVDAAWARWVRPWVLAAWICLTLGIALGSYWAYYELGWGGWWFWDPVENASLMPWLLGTALLHSALVLERRGALVSWTILLAILTFSFSLLGTFLVRSGILTSVHAFAVDATRGVYILVLIAASTGVALALFAWRAPAMRTGAMFSTVSREASLTINNLLLMVATVTVALGTFYPVIVETLSSDKISVGPPFYNLTFAPIFGLLLVLVPFGPVLNWRQDKLRTLWRRVRLPAMVALLTLGLALLFAGPKLFFAGLGLTLAAWLILGAIMILAHRWRVGQGAKTPWWQAARNTPLAVYGMVLAHAGLGVTTAGVTAMAAWETSRILVMKAGQSIDFGGVDITLVEVREKQGPNYLAELGVFHLKRGSRIDEMTAERRFFPVRQTQTTEAAIKAEVSGNYYFVIGESQGDGRVVRIYHHPLVGWIWFGTLFMALGGVASLSDRRFRLGLRRGTDVALPIGMEPVEA